MTGYQKIKKERDRLSELWLIGWNAMMEYVSKCQGEINQKDLIIINALNKAGKIMNNNETN